MARAIAEAEPDHGPVALALDRVARYAGRSLGAQVRGLAGPRAGRAAQQAAVHRVLSASGFQPRDDGAEVLLTNCPFHALAQAYPSLVCGMSLHLLEGLLEGMDDLGAYLDPAPDRCCVTIRHRR